MKAGHTIQSRYSLDERVSPLLEKLVADLLLRFPNTNTMSGPGMTNTNTMSGPGITNSNTMSGPGITNSDTMSGPGMTNTNTMSGPGMTNTNAISSPGMANTNAISSPGMTNVNTMSGPGLLLLQGLQTFQVSPSLAVSQAVSSLPIVSSSQVVPHAVIYPEQVANNNTIMNLRKMLGIAEAGGIIDLNFCTSTLQPSLIPSITELAVKQSSIPQSSTLLCANSAPDENLLPASTFKENISATSAVHQASLPSSKSINKPSATINQAIASRKEVCDKVNSDELCTVSTETESDISISKKPHTSATDFAKSTISTDSIKNKSPNNFISEHPTIKLKAKSDKLDSSKILMSESPCKSQNVSPNTSVRDLLDDSITILNCYACGLCGKELKDQKVVDSHALAEHNRKVIPYRVLRCPDYIKIIVSDVFSKQENISESSPRHIILKKSRCGVYGEALAYPSTVRNHHAVKHGSRVPVKIAANPNFDDEEFKILSEMIASSLKSSGEGLPLDSKKSDFFEEAKKS
ncbi:hypothetical protein GQR58_015408 [Nymphon striatum]|nr:hypothetical protein GQR58_015408 [Nymphon striatum]